MSLNVFAPLFAYLVIDVYSIVWYSIFIELKCIAWYLRCAELCPTHKHIIKIQYTTKHARTSKLLLLAGKVLSVSPQALAMHILQLFTL